MRSSFRPLVLAAALLLIAAGRLLRLRGLELDADEVWTIWQTFGSPRQILAWTPYDWPPLHFLALGAWKELAGIHPVAVRMFSVLALLPGAACAYRAVRRGHGHTAGAIAMLTYAALAYVIYASLIVRGYVLLLALLPAAVWLMQRFFDRPAPRRAIPLALCLAAMFYTHLTSVLAFAALGLYSLIVYRRKVWCWWLPGVLAGALALPEIARKLSIATSSTRLEAVSGIDLPPLPRALAELFQFATGEWAVAWAILLAAVTVAVLWRTRPLTRRAAAWLAWLVLGALALYVTNPLLGFFRLRYGTWLLLALAAWIGIGAARLPRALRGLTVGFLAVSLFAPLPMAVLHEGMTTPPMLLVFDWLRDQVRWGDVLVIDPSVAPNPEMWDYYTRVYFPNGLAVVSDPAGYRRVWYATVDGWEDPALAAAVREDRVAGRFVGPWDLLVRLYEAPPSVAGDLFENGMRFHGAEISRPHERPHDALAWREGETLRVRLWWSVDEPVAADYSVGVHLRAPDGALLAQSDSAPQVADGPGATSQWQPGRFYVEERTITLPESMKTARYTLSLVVYEWPDLTPIGVPGADEDGLLPLAEIPVKAW